MYNNGTIYDNLEYVILTCLLVPNEALHVWIGHLKCEQS